MTQNATRENLAQAVVPHIARGATCCIGVSGGGDSIALLQVLATLREEHGFRLVALHMNHRLRGAESDADERFCRGFCRSLDVQLRVKRLAVAAYAGRHRLSIEDAARRCRFEWFEQQVAALGAYCIFLAHHADDQAETLLLRLFRGAGLRGIAGMKHTTTFRSLEVVRPWLGIRRHTIAAYRAALNLPCRHDSSNDDTHFDRNWVRKCVLPLIASRCGDNVAGRMAATATLCRDVEDYVMHEAARVYERHGCLSSLGLGIPLEQFAHVHVALQRALVRHLIDLLQAWEQQHIEFDAIEAVRSFALGDEADLERPLPRPLHALKAYGHLFIGRAAPRAVVPSRIKSNGETDIGNGLTVRIERVARRGKGVSDNGEAWRDVALGTQVAMVQYATLPARAMLAVRPRGTGDRYCPVHGCEKRIKEMLIEAHVPQMLKDAVPVITANGRPVWLAGWRIADAFKATPGGGIFKLTVYCDVARTGAC